MLNTEAEIPLRAKQLQGLQEVISHFVNGKSLEF